MNYIDRTLINLFVFLSMYLPFLFSQELIKKKMKNLNYVNSTKKISELSIAGFFILQDFLRRVSRLILLQHIFI